MTSKPSALGVNCSQQHQQTAKELHDYEHTSISDKLQNDGSDSLKPDMIYANIEQDYRPPSYHLDPGGEGHGGQSQVKADDSLVYSELEDEHIAAPLNEVYANLSEV